MSPTKTVTSPPRGSAALAGNGSRPRISRAEAIARFERLRSVVPVFAQEVVSARREAARLRAENGWLIEQVRELGRGRAQSNPAVSLSTSRGGTWR